MERAGRCLVIRKEQQTGDDVPVTPYTLRLPWPFVVADVMVHDGLCSHSLGESSSVFKHRWRPVFRRTLDGGLDRKSKTKSSTCPILALRMTRHSLIAKELGNGQCRTLCGCSKGISRVMPVRTHQLGRFRGLYRRDRCRYVDVEDRSISERSPATF